jgi:hypothetical protein
MLQKKRDFLKVRIISLIALVALSIVGFWMWKCYRGWGQYWIKDYISGIVYVMILSVGLFAVLPSRKNVLRIPLVIFVLTCGLEFLQLYQPPILQAFRKTLIGAALIGTSFVPLQFPFYIVGALCSYLLLKLIFSSATGRIHLWRIKFKIHIISTENADFLKKIILLCR